MVGVPIDLLWFGSLGSSMAEGSENKKSQGKKKKRSRKQEERDRYDRVLWRPFDPFPLP